MTVKKKIIVGKRAHGKGYLAFLPGTAEPQTKTSGYVY